MLKLKIAISAMLLTLVMGLPCPPRAEQADSNPTIEIQVPDIEHLILSLRKHRALMPACWIEVLERAVDIYLTYKNGKNIRTLKRIVHAALSDLAALEARVRSGELRMDAELVSFRTLLAEHGERLKLVAAERVMIERLERIVLRRGCKPLHAWRHSRCINVVDFPRRQ